MNISNITNSRGVPAIDVAVLGINIGTKAVNKNKVLNSMELTF